MIRGNTNRKRPREQSEQWTSNEISFSSMSGCQLVDSPIILEALIKGFQICKIYVDGGSSSEVMYEHCFQSLKAETKAKLKESIRYPLESPWLRIRKNRRVGKSSQHRTVIRMIRGNTNRKRPREQSEQWKSNKISFSSMLGCQLVDSPIILEELIEGFQIRKIYVDGGSSSEVMYEPCFRSLRAETKAKLKESRTPLVWFSGEVSYPIETINLRMTMGEPGRLRTILIEFAVVKSHSPYNVILGRTGLRSLGVVASTIHSMIKFPTANGIATMTTKKETLQECRRMEEAKGKEGSRVQTDKTGEPDGIIQPSPISSKKYTQANEKGKEEDKPLEKSPGSKPP
ncbi:hypothetical protein Tco_0322874 [Tanacetum coccineum]